MKPSEDQKRTTVKLAAVLGWLGVALVTLLRVTEAIGPNWGVLSLPLIGMAILAGISWNRYKLQDTMVAALQAGYNLARSRHRSWHARETEEDEPDIEPQLKQQIEEWRERNGS